MDVILIFLVFQLAALGGFILFLGFFFFNGGSQAAIGDGDGPIVALAGKKMHVGHSRNLINLSEEGEGSLGPS